MRKQTAELSEQGGALLWRALNFLGHLVPNFFALKIATLAQLVRALFDLLMGIKSVMGAAKFRIHHNGIPMRNPHDKPLVPDRAQV